MTAIWEPYEPTNASPWTLARAVHLHRRAGFGATWDELQRDLADGPETAIGRVLGGTARLSNVPDGFEALAGEIGDAAVISGDPQRLKAWWFYRMICSPDPLAERLTLTWHNHFATSNFKVRSLAMMRRQNEIFRKHGRGRFKAFLSAVLHDPAVLIWLDSESNRKGYPNENLARELMELFTLGAGNFSETDVKQAARALTGWSVADENFIVRPYWHDEGPKTILGQTGNWDGDDLVRILCAHPATSHRLAWRICQTFMGENVAGAPAIDALAAGLREHDLEVNWAVETVLRSRLFFSDQNMGTQISGPVEFLVGPVQALGLFDPPPSTLVLAEWCARLGQDLFYPPNVGGWAGGRSWLSTRTIIARANYATALVRGELNAPAAPPTLAAIAQSARRGGSTAEALRFFNDLLLGGAIAPEGLEKIRQACLGARAMESDPLATGLAMMLARPEAQLI